MHSVSLNEAVVREVGILQDAQPHDSVIELVDAMDESDRTYAVMELMTGGNLLSRVVQAQGLLEGTAKRMIKSVLEALVHLHGKGICHNDLQPSNILLDGTDTAKIADFGRAFYVEEVSIYSVPCVPSKRNISYLAPELLSGTGHASTAADMWSAGAIVYFCLFGHAPFFDVDTGRASLPRALRADYSFPSDNNDVSRAAKQFISNLVHTDPSVRLTAREALQHPWLVPPQEAPVSRPSFLMRSLSLDEGSERMTFRSLARRLMCKGRPKDPLKWKTLQSPTPTDISVACSSLLACDMGSSS